MRIYEINTDYGIIWYCYPDYKGDLINVVCYGLDVRQVSDAGEARRRYDECVKHAKVCNGELDNAD